MLQFCSVHVFMKKTFFNNLMEYVDKDKKVKKKILNVMQQDKF